MEEIKKVYLTGREKEMATPLLAQIPNSKKNTTTVALK